MAPEFGVAESQSLVQVLREHHFDALADRFLQVALDSRKWEKWMLPETKATDEERSIIAGHYVFAADPCREIKQVDSMQLRRKNIDLEQYLKEQVKKSSLRYMRHFRLTKNS